MEQIELELPGNKQNTKMSALAPLLIANVLFVEFATKNHKNFPSQKAFQKSKGCLNTGIVSIPTSTGRAGGPVTALGSFPTGTLQNARGNCNPWP